MASQSNASAQLISHIRLFQDGQWDPRVLRRTELCLLDSLGCYSSGRFAKHFAPSATVGRMLGLTSEGLVSPFAFAYLYGQAANLLDYDDTLLGHPGPPILSAVLSVGVRDRLPIDRLLRGIAAGYEVETILAASAAPSPERAALVRSVGVWDTVAASIGVCVALGLKEDMMNRVIGVAVAHSLLPYTAKWYERPVPAMKNNLGWAAAGAVLSADLAVAGQTGVTNALEGDAGMWRMAGSDRWNLERDLFQRPPAVLRVGFKYFPACWHRQEYLKTLSKLLASLPPDDEVVEIVVEGPKEVEKFCNREIIAPTDVAFSLPVTASLLISKVEPGLLWTSFEDGASALRFKNEFRYEFSDIRTMSLRTQSGSSLKAPVDKYDPSNPAPWGLDEAGVLAKHGRLTEATLRSGAEKALAARGVPDALYTALNRLMAANAAPSA